MQIQIKTRIVIVASTMSKRKSPNSPTLLLELKRANITTSDVAISTLTCFFFYSNDSYNEIEGELYIFMNDTLLL